MRVAARKDEEGQFITSWGARSHFHESEFACKDGCGLKDMDQEFIDGVERLRVRLTLPIIPISGVRCLAHNKAEGGATRSQHLPDENGIGNAADLIAPNVSSSYLYLLSLEIEQIRGRGLRATSLHVDSRPDRASWMYDDYKGLKPEMWMADLASKAFQG